VDFLQFFHSSFDFAQDDARALPAVRAGSRTRPGVLNCFKGADQVLNGDALLLRKTDTLLLRKSDEIECQFLQSKKTVKIQKNFTLHRDGRGGLG
jgi:hypothetical protein